MNRSNFLKLLGAGTATALFGKFPHAAYGSEASAVAYGNIPDRLDEGEVKTLEAFVSKPVTAIVIGAGSRGSVYARYSGTYPKALSIVGVSDTLDNRKQAMAQRYHIPAENQFGDWSEVFTKPKFADAVIISTPDHLHYQPCMRALEMGYDVLLEKPIAQTAQECLDIQAQAAKYQRVVGVCHVLRYAPYFVALKETIDSGVIGDVVSMQHFEPVQYAHMAHSYVRGNWHNSKETTPIILAKSCHDLDIIRWMLNRKCTAVSAFGELTYFKPANAPEGSADRCLNCRIESKCPYSAIKIYLKDRGWLKVFDLPDDKSQHDEIIREKLRTTNYGKCVFHCNNDQCDHYVMNMQFEDGLTAGFNMEAFASFHGRRTRVFGTKGDINGDMESFTVTDFLTGKQTKWYEDISKLYGYTGHGGGDWGIVRDFVLAVSNHDTKFLSSTVDISVESHLMGFKAEESRLQKKIVNI
jgi:predicted dehydrogenase